MKQKICLFLDYLSILSPDLKNRILVKNDIKVAQDLRRSENDDSDFYYNEERIYQYGNLIRNLRGRFATDAPNILHAVLQLDNLEHIQNIFKDFNEDFNEFLRNRKENIYRIPQWALNGSNWFLIESENSAYELESKISIDFPVLVFDNVPIEASSIPEINITNVEDIIKFTGLYKLWQKKNFGERIKIAVLDTGVTNSLVTKYRIQQDSVANFNGEDNDGHGSAMIETILSICPKADIISIKIIESYNTGEIWNFFAGLTKLLNEKNVLVNLSIGLNPHYLKSLGHSQTSLKEATVNIINGSNANNNFHISAAGNDSIKELRWPAAINNVLAVGSHNLSNDLSEFSNYDLNSKNIILTLGGDRRKFDSKIESMGKYGHSHSRDLYGTSVSTAITTGICGLLMNYDWFKQMSPESKISLFTSHCRKNNDGLPILNISDIGAIWPI